MKNYNEDDDILYFLEVDVKYPEQLHETLFARKNGKLTSSRLWNSFQVDEWFSFWKSHRKCNKVQGY